MKIQHEVVLTCRVLGLCEVENSAPFPRRHHFPFYYFSRAILKYSTQRIPSPCASCQRFVAEASFYSGVA